MLKCFFVCVLVGAFVMLAGCRHPPVARPTTTPAPEPIVVRQESRFHNDPQMAIEDLAERLFNALQSHPRPQQIIVPVDDFFSAQSAEVSASGRMLQRQLASVLSQRLSPLQFSPLSSKNVGNAQWLVLANYKTLKPGETATAGTWVRLQVALANTETGETLAKAETYLDTKQFNSGPTRFFKDAPMFMTDDRHREKLAVMAGEKHPLSQSIQVQALFADAISDYESDRLEEAVKGFSGVHGVARDHPGALAGLYQSTWRLGRRNEAEQAFSKLVAVGLDAGTLSFKLLFKVGSTDFIDNADLSTQYRLWLRAVAEGAVAKRKCVDVTGHASKSGTAEMNNRLSLQRAERVVAQLAQVSPATRGKFRAHGKGFEQTIVGTGVDDASDAIDRRVEFTVKPCP